MRLAPALLLSLCLIAPSTRVSADVGDGLAAFRVGIQPGCAVGRYSADAAPVFEVAGYADLQGKRPITPRTRFIIASASKQFTALAVLTLADEGRIDLDAPARRYLPEMAGAVGEATVRQLLNQTAGVRDHTTLFALLGIERLGSIDRTRTLALMARQSATNFTPGSRAAYSNGNYLLLSEIVARVAGMPFETYLQRAIFRPLGMRDSSAIGARPPAGRLAHGYDPDRDGGYALADDVPATSGSGGVITTVADLALFDRDFRLERIVWRPKIKAQMLKPGLLNDGSTAILPEFGTPYGAGLGLEQRDGDLWVAHDGGAEGFAAQYIRVVGARRGVAVLCNRADGAASELAEKLLAPPQPTAAPTSGAARPQPAPPRPFTETAVIAGRYRASDLDAIYDFRPSGQGFEVTITSPWTPGPVIDTWGGLRRYGADEFGTGPIRVTFERRGDHAEVLTLRFGRRVEGLKLVRIAE